MLISFIENFILGFLITAVPGAVFFETIRRSALDRPSIIRFQAGNFTGIVIIIVACHLGVATLAADRVVASVFYFVSASLLLYIGIVALLQNEKKLKHQRSRHQKPKGAAYVSGLILALANPISILFWVSLTGRFVSEQTSQLGVILNSVVVLLGALALFVLLITTSGFLRERLSLRHLTLVSKLFGLVIVGYGLKTLWSAAQVWL